VFGSPSLRLLTKLFNAIQKQLGVLVDFVGQNDEFYRNQKYRRFQQKILGQTFGEKSHGKKHKRHDDDNR
jgi:hypothetical protein